MSIPTELLGKRERIKTENRKVSYFCFNFVHKCQKDLVTVTNNNKMF